MITQGSKMVNLIPCAIRLSIVLTISIHWQHLENFEPLDRRTLIPVNLISLSHHMNNNNNNKTKYA